ncbi:MAG: hypothetical protein GY797_37295, partial [Deltaproteobacteria bacterium]|nr:hypothetical protein [Deltaproteobacteria bacterium]
VLFSRLLDNRLLATPAEVKRPLVPDKESDQQEDKELTFGETVIRNVVTTANLIEEDEQFVVGELEWLFCALDNFLQVYEIVRKRVDQAKTRVIRNFALNIQRDKEMDRIKSQIWQEEIERSQSLFVPIPPEAQRSPQANNRLLSTNDEYYLNLWAFQTEGSVKTTNLRLRNLDVLLKREAKGGEAGKSNIALQNQIRDIRIEIARDLQDFSDLMNKSYGIFLTSPKKLLDLLM